MSFREGHSARPQGRCCRRGIPLLALGMAPRLQRACECPSCQQSLQAQRGREGKITVWQPLGMDFPEKV